MNGALTDRLKAIFRDIETDDVRDGRLTVLAPAASVLSVLRLLRSDGYGYLQLISCVDWIDDGQLEVVYVLSRYLDGEGGIGGGPIRVVLKTRVPRTNASLPTAIEIYPIAEPYEREVHELFGVRFEGHPRLTPLFLEREYEIPPFRKDFDTRQYVEDVFGSVPAVGEESQDS